MSWSRNCPHCQNMSVTRAELGIGSDWAKRMLLMDRGPGRSGNSAERAYSRETPARRRNVVWALPSAGLIRLLPYPSAERGSNPPGNSRNPTRTMPSLRQVGPTPRQNNTRRFPRASDRFSHSSPRRNETEPASAGMAGETLMSTFQDSESCEVWLTRRLSTRYSVPRQVKVSSLRSPIVRPEMVL